MTERRMGAYWTKGCGVFWCLAYAVAVSSTLLLALRFLTFDLLLSSVRGEELQLIGVSLAEYNQIGAQRAATPRAVPTFFSSFS